MLFISCAPLAITFPSARFSALNGSVDQNALYGRACVSCGNTVCVWAWGTYGVDGNDVHMAVEQDRGGVWIPPLPCQDHHGFPFHTLHKAS